MRRYSLIRKTFSSNSLVQVLQHYLNPICVTDVCFNVFEKALGMESNGISLQDIESIRIKILLSEFADIISLLVFQSVLLSLK